LLTYAAMRSLVLVLIVSAGVPLAACGGSSREPAGDDAGADAAPTATTTSSTSTGTGGTVLLLQAFGGGSGEVAAQIPQLEAGVGPEETCGAPVVSGACQLTSCQSGGIGSPASGYGDFGPISATVGTTTIPIDYSGIGYPTEYFPAGVTLGEGGIMTFRGGNGGSVPSFDVPLTIPGLAVIMSPVPDVDGGSASIDTSHDLTVTWVPISIGQIEYSLSTNVLAPNHLDVTIACAFDGSSGSGVVPQALLASMKTAAAGDTVYASMQSELQTTTVVGDLTIETQSFQSTTNDSDDYVVTLE